MNLGETLTHMSCLILVGVIVVGVSGGSLLDDTVPRRRATPPRQPLGGVDRVSRDSVRCRAGSFSVVSNFAAQ